MNEESATTSVSIQVGGDGPGAADAPLIIIEGPMDEEYLATDIVTVIAQVQDNEQDWNTCRRASFRVETANCGLDFPMRLVFWNWTRC